MEQKTYKVNINEKRDIGKDIKWKYLINEWI